MTTVTRVCVGMWVALVALALSAGAAYAAAGDAGKKGETLYVWHLDEGTGDEVKEAGADGCGPR